MVAFPRDETKTRPLLCCFGTFRIEHLLVALCNAIGLRAQAIRNKLSLHCIKMMQAVQRDPRKHTKKKSRLDVPSPSLTLSLSSRTLASRKNSNWGWIQGGLVVVLLLTRSLINMWPETKRCADGGDQDRSIIRLEGFARDCVSPPHRQQAHWSICSQLKPSLNREPSSQSDTVQRPKNDPLPVTWPRPRSRPRRDRGALSLLSLCSVPQHCSVTYHQLVRICCRRCWLLSFFDDPT